MQSDPKKQDIKALREQYVTRNISFPTSSPVSNPTYRRNLLHGVNLRQNLNQIPFSSFVSRKNALIAAYRRGEYLKDPGSVGQPAPNPMSDPAGMDQMMNMLKGNMAMIVPQTLIMGWINAFFSGFVIMKLPFPLTIRFKSMLQSGVATSDLDVRWVSSLSWYFLNLFGLRSVFNYILGSDNCMPPLRVFLLRLWYVPLTRHDSAADQMAAQMQQMNPAAGGASIFGPGQDPNKMFIAEIENLEVAGGQHEWVLNGVEDRVLAMT